jgi:HD-GYP domain-containing protein (c-di-GMP phosphodiesterase class II)
MSIDAGSASAGSNLLPRGLVRGEFDSLSDHLRALHSRLLDLAPDIDRIACALYDSEAGVLKTFINSTREGVPLAAYEFPLAGSASLSMLAQTGQARALNDLPNEIDTGTEHSTWVIGMGYVSSFTVPLYSGNALIGFLFFDSKKADAFPPQVQRELLVYSQLIALAIVNEVMVIKSILGSVHLARDFAELRDLETGAHLERMSRYARIIAQGLAASHDLADEFVERVFLYAPLHDVGKIGVPDRVLLKKGPLTADEREIMQSHALKGADMVESITRDLGLARTSAYQMMLNIVELHHESPDGSGYPHGLTGDRIPLESRIVAVADVFDALSSKRPYKRAWGISRASAELNRLAGLGKLDSECVKALLDRIDDAVEIRNRHREMAG